MRLLISGSQVRALVRPPLFKMQINDLEDKLDGERAVQSPGVINGVTEVSLACADDDDRGAAPSR